jgi:hypothetical protein
MHELLWEDGPQEKPRRVNRRDRPAVLRGLSPGMYVRVQDALDYMGWSWSTWARMRRAGLLTDCPGKRTEYIDTTTLIAFLKKRSRLNRDRHEP